MSLIIVFDPNATPNNVLEVIPSGSTDQYFGRSDVLINPDISALAAVPQQYWKHVFGTVVEMTAPEKNAVDSAIVATALAVMRLTGKSIIDAASDTGILQRAFADISKDEFNDIRRWLVSLKAEVAAATTYTILRTRVATLPNMPDRTLAQLRTGLLNRIDSGTVDS